MTTPPFPGQFLHLVGGMDLAFDLPRLHERLSVARKPPVRGRGPADEGYALGLEGGSPGDDYFFYRGRGRGGGDDTTLCVWEGGARLP